MDEILHHLGWLKPINNGVIIILGGAGFCPSTVAKEYPHFQEEIHLQSGSIFQPAMLVYWRVPTKKRPRFLQKIGLISNGRKKKGIII